MKGIEINGKKLHEVALYQTPHAPGVSVALRYPKQRIQYRFEQVKAIEAPTLWAVELYRSDIIPQDLGGLLIIKESGRQIGVFLMKKVIYPDSFSNEGVGFEIEKTNE